MSFLARGIFCHKTFFAAVLLSVVLIGARPIPLSAQQNPAMAKFSTKIEKVIINQILKDLKEKDYESYLLLSGMWQGIKNQSAAGIDRSLQQLLVEKGFIYTLYSKGYKYTEAGIAFTFFSEDFFTWLEKEDSTYLTMLVDRYDYMLSAAQLSYTYFAPDSHFNMRTLLNDVVALSNVPPEDVAGTAEFMASHLLRTNYIPFKNRAALEEPANRKVFVAALQTYLTHNNAQYAGYRAMDKSDGHRRISEKIRMTVNRYGHSEWVQRGASEAVMKEVYLEMISYTTRVMLSGDQEFATNSRAGRFPAMKNLLQRVDKNLKTSGDSLAEIRAALLVRLLQVSRQGQRAKYASLAALYSFTNTLIDHARQSVRLYQQSGSLFESVRKDSGHEFKQYFVQPWYRDFYRSGWFGNEFLRVDDQYVGFYNTMQITALMTDYIISRDDAKLVANFQKYAWGLMLSAQGAHQFYKEQLTAAKEASRRAGLTANEATLIDAALDHIMGLKSHSELIRVTKDYLANATKIDRYAQGMAKKFEQHLERGPLQNAPYLQAYYLKIAQAISPEGDLSVLDADLAKLNQHLIAEALSWKSDGAFALYSVRFDYELPTLGTSVRSILSLLAANDRKSFRSTLLTSYNQSLDTSLGEMPEKTRSVSEPFIRSAMTSVITGQKTTSEEYTNIAMQSLKGIERQNYWLHFSLGFGVGQFISPKSQSSASKVFLSDMIGVDFIGLIQQLNEAPRPPWMGFGFFVGGILDYMVSEAAKLDTRNLPGGNNYLKTGIFLNFRHPDNTFVNFSIMGGAAFNLSGEPVYFVAATWNVFEVMDFF